MEAGLIYDCGSDEIMPEQMQYQDALWRFNHMGPSEFEERQELMKEIFAECGENTFLLDRSIRTGAADMCTSDRIYMPTST